MRKKPDGLTLGPLWVHRREQYDLDCKPWVCVHLVRANSTTRLLCLWRRGLDLGPLLITKRGIRYSHIFWRIITKG